MMLLVWVPRARAHARVRGGRPIQGQLTIIKQGVTFAPSDIRRKRFSSRVKWPPGKCRPDARLLAAAARGRAITADEQQVHRTRCDRLGREYGKVRCTRSARAVKARRHKVAKARAEGRSLTDEEREALDALADKARADGDEHSKTYCSWEDTPHFARYLATSINTQAIGAVGRRAPYEPNTLPMVRPYAGCQDRRLPYLLFQDGRYLCSPRPPTLTEMLQFIDFITNVIQDTQPGHAALAHIEYYKNQLLRLPGARELSQRIAAAGADGGGGDGGPDAVAMAADALGLDSDTGAGAGVGSAADLLAGSTTTAPMVPGAAMGIPAAPGAAVGAAVGASGPVRRGRPKSKKARARPNPYGGGGRKRPRKTRARQAKRGRRTRARRHRARRRPTRRR